MEPSPITIRLWARALLGAINVARHRPLVLHQSHYTRALPDNILFLTFCCRYRGMLRKPDGLAIVEVHNRPYKTLLERNLDYLGIEEHSVLRVNVPKWNHTIKLIELLRFTTNCRDDYILYCDSDDAILIDDPRKAIDLLRENECEMLVSATAYGSYGFMPDRKAWSRKIAAENGYKSNGAIYMNAGVFVAKKKFLIHVLTEALKFVSDNDLDSESWKAVKRRKDRSALPNFPRGCGCDQEILRFLHPKFYPRMKIDYSLKLAVRSRLGKPRRI
jgi:hypothetical protein